ncbi:phosphomevalonate kinase [Miniimonas arenae]|uniref:phosphomevalonate kinase n=1 Tax=Miniimonas arenae TaxID=676201 RepID=A0A5C5BAY6_9MICO|nr:phosphomevalonate kinase [Miniimonas arenae]TNU73212.1 phosphomevalonate kinase [Miniimonas arenae]
MRRVVASAPGKLFVGGEHAVTDAGQPAVLVAVDRRLELTLASSDRTRGLDQEGRYVRAVAAVIAHVAAERGRDGGPYAVSTRSTLVDPAVGDAPARKYGLGSSAAVTVAAVRGLDVWHGLGLTPQEQFKVALLATLRVNPRASGADVATSLRGGWVSYCSPDRAWVHAHDDADDPAATARLVRAEWPGLASASLPTPTSLALRVGWTGSPASTVSIVSAVRAVGLTPQFLAASRAGVDALVAAVQADDPDAARDAVRTIRAALRDLGSAVGVGIETPLLTALADAAEAHGFAGKSSGAGGGDCGIAVGAAGDEHAVAGLEAAWAEAGIVPLHLAVDAGAWVEDSESDAEGDA